MTQNTFTLDYNVTGAERKRLVKAISGFTGADAKYLGVPSCAYQVDFFHIDKNGRVSFDDRADSEVIENLIEALAAEGFTAEAPETMPAEEEPAEIPDTGLQILLPLDGFEPDSLDRLTRLIDSKANLIRKALGADRLTVQRRDGAVCFPWWDTMPSPEETSAYTAFIAALCRMAKEAKRVTATEKDVESEKYAFRGFLLRLGFIGAESKEQRKFLLKNLSGSAAFPNKEKADAFSAAQKAKRDAAKEEQA
ncbi:MAG: virulence protein [Oscillospiraceae bacterium]|nr:virulence protein [Oscillospiraceae bacterium]